MTKERARHEARWARTEAEYDAIKTTVREIPARLASVDDAVRIALINDRGLQMTYAGVGIGESDLLRRAGRAMPASLSRTCKAAEPWKSIAALSFVLRWVNSAVTTDQLRIRHSWTTYGHAINRDMSAVCNSTGGSRPTKPTHIVFVVVTAAVSEKQGRGDA
jgi:hypothetical protein